MWNPVKTDNSKVIIYNHAKKSIEKDLSKLKEKTKQASDKLLVADDTNSTIKRRAKMRLNLTVLCEECDSLEKALEKLEELQQDMPQL